MYDIEKIIDEVITIYKKKKPEYHGTYQLSVEMMEAIKVHAVKGVIPEKLIAKRSPNQTEEEFNYIKENYKQVTLPVFVDLISTIQRAFNDNNWSLTYPEDAKEDSLKVYLDEGLKDTPLRMDLESWIKSVVPSIKCIDAMGCVVVKPWFIPTVEQDGEMVISGDRFEPVPFYYDSSRLLSYQENIYYLFLMHEKSKVRVGDKDVPEGLIFELYDKDVIYRIEQTGDKNDYSFNFIEYYRHDLGQIPVTRLKGGPFYTDDGDLVWSSPMINVTDILDEAILDNNNLRAIKNKCVYPFRVMIGDTCDNQMTVDGVVLNCQEGWFNDHKIKCLSCHGTGRKTRVNPYGELILNPDAFLASQDNGMSSNAMYYVEPTPSTTDTLRKEINYFLSHALSILYRNNTNENVQPTDNLTATKTLSDEKSRYMLIKGISDQIFDLYKFLIDMIGRMRYEDYNPPVLVYPVNFDLKGEAEYLKEIGEAIEKQVPQVAVQAITMKYLNSLFYNSGEQGQYYDIILNADRLFTMSDDDIALKLVRGVIANWEVILHDSAVSFIRELIRKEPGYLEGEMQVKIDKLVTLSKEKAIQIKPPLVASITERILNGNPQPVT